MNAITLENIHKTFGSQEVIKGIQLSVADGEFVVFVGPSGCGKTTLLRLLSGLETVTSGTITIKGKDVTYQHPASRGIAMVFQSYALFPHMSVFQNIAFGLKLRKEQKSSIKKKVANVAELLQITALLERKPRELSGGQRQRVAIGRALVRNPAVFLFDEPLSNLDAALRVQMRVELSELHRRLKATIIYVTHDQTEAMTLADKIVVLKDGKIEQVGTPLTLYTKPINTFVAKFIGSPSINLLTLPYKLSSYGKLSMTLAGIQLSFKPNRHPVGKTVTLGIRPEDFVIANAKNTKSTKTFPAKLVIVEYLGAETFIHVNIPQHKALLILKVSAKRSYTVGESLQLSIAADSCYLFDEKGLTLT